jgi:ABC-type uncharacterized transport system ATPase subunit
MTDAPKAMSKKFLIETRGLTKEFNGFVAASGVDLRVRRGQIHALIGPNGAAIDCSELGTVRFFVSVTRLFH